MIYHIWYWIWEHDGVIYALKWLRCLLISLELTFPLPLVEAFLFFACIKFRLLSVLRLECWLSPFKSFDQKYIPKIYSTNYFNNNDERGIEKCTIICSLCSLLDLFYGQDSNCRICPISIGFIGQKHGILQDINSKPHFHKIFSKTTMLSPTRHLYFLIDNRWFLHWCDHYANWLVQSTYFIWNIWLLSHHWWPQLP